ncbi:hypothetical protein, partial [Escherichia coli]
KGYFGFDILGAIPFHRPTKWGQYKSSPAPSGLSAQVPLSPKSAAITLNSLKRPYPAIKSLIGRQNVATSFQLST